MNQTRNNDNNDKTVETDLIERIIEPPPPTLPRPNFTIAVKLFWRDIPNTARVLLVAASLFFCTTFATLLTREIAYRHSRAYFREDVQEIKAIVIETRDKVIVNTDRISNLEEKAQNK